MISRETPWTPVYGRGHARDGPLRLDHALILSASSDAARVGASCSFAAIAPAAAISVGIRMTSDDDGIHGYILELSPNGSARLVRLVDSAADGSVSAGADTDRAFAAGQEVTLELAEAAAGKYRARVNGTAISWTGDADNMEIDATDDTMGVDISGSIYDEGAMGLHSAGSAYCWGILHHTLRPGYSGPENILIDDRFLAVTPGAMALNLGLGTGGFSPSSDPTLQEFIAAYRDAQAELAAHALRMYGGPYYAAETRDIHVSELPVDITALPRHGFSAGGWSRAPGIGYVQLTHRDVIALVSAQSVAADGTLSDLDGYAVDLDSGRLYLPYSARTGVQSLRLSYWHGAPIEDGSDAQAALVRLVEYQLEFLRSRRANYAPDDLRASLERIKALRDTIIIPLLDRLRGENGWSLI